MGLTEAIILLVAAFFALNMGSPSFAGSFSTACGSAAVSKKMGSWLFLILGIAGGIVFGKPVANTLSRGIIPAEFINSPTALIILSAATMSLFTANMMHIPQSTSLSTIASICGVGVFRGSVNLDKIGFLAVCWISATVVTFLLIYGAAKCIYPPRRSNFWIYERLVHHKARLKYFVVFTSCYKAFAQGSNNVANAVGPLAAAGILGLQPGLWIMGALFGLGAWAFTGPIKMASEKIVPLGLLSATVINLVSGTVTIVASKMGIPLPTVIVYTVSIFAVSTIKDGLLPTWEKPLARKTLLSWGINPIITFAASYGLSWIFLNRI